MPGISGSLIAGEGILAAVAGLTAIDFALLGTSSLITGPHFYCQSACSVAASKQVPGWDRVVHSAGIRVQNFMA